ncbi:MAG: translation elongation factor Ts [Anaerolineae bacterium]
MANITAQMVKELREETGAGVLDCKKALEQYEGDFEKAAAYLREQGMAAAAKRAEREAKEGLIGSYIHAGDRVAGLVEVNCETDFVARTDEFQELAHDLAMQVVAAKPAYVNKEDVPEEVLKAQRDLYRQEALESGKPEAVVERIVEGKMAKFVEDVCLIEQPFIKDPSITVGELVKQNNAVLGENIVVRRFARLEVGG